MSRFAITVNIASVKPNPSCGWNFHSHIDNDDGLINNPGKSFDHLILDIIA
jgi:hypothetical protein